VVPSHYALRIAPGTDRFEGEAGIDLEVKRPVQAIVLNASELSFKSVKLRAADGNEQMLAPSFDPKEETVTLAPSRAPIAPGSYRLDIEYFGKIGRHPQGLYRLSTGGGAGRGLVAKRCSRPTWAGERAQALSRVGRAGVPRASS
jgi:aminopeptidase N